MSAMGGARLSVRMLSLLVAAIISGAMIQPVLGSVGSAAPAATNVVWVSCPGTGFTSASQPTDFNTDTDGGRYGTGRFTCPLFLPDHAVVRDVVFRFWDDHPSARVGDCFVSRSPIAPPNGTFQDLAGPLRTSVPDGPGYERRNDDSIAFSTVDNHHFAYVARCELYFSHHVRLLGVNVELTT